MPEAQEGSSAESQTAGLQDHTYATSAPALLFLLCTWTQWPIDPHRLPHCPVFVLQGKLGQGPSALGKPLACKL